MANGDQTQLAIMMATEAWRFYQTWRSKARVAGATDADIDAAIEKFDAGRYPDPLAFEGGVGDVPPPLVDFPAPRTPLPVDEVPQTDPGSDDGGGSTVDAGIYYNHLSVRPLTATLKSGDKVYLEADGYFFITRQNGPGTRIPSTWTLLETKP